MKFFDTHAHLNFPDYNKDRDEIIKKNLQEGIFVINIGTGIAESKEVVEISKKYKEGVYASLGVHPHYIEKDFSTKEKRDFVFASWEELVKEKSVVAIGEIGLDYLNIKKEVESDIKKKQKEELEAQIDFAKKTNLPVIFHCRKAHKDLLGIVREKYSERKERRNGVLHCFTGKRRELFEFLDLGFYIGVNGIIFKMDLEKVIKEIPLERMLLETDCPFLSPLKEEERNEPIFIQYIAKEVARIKKISTEEVAEITTENAKNLFLS